MSFGIITIGINGAAGTIATILIAGEATGSAGGGADLSFGPNGMAIIGGGTIHGMLAGAIGGATDGGGKILGPRRLTFMKMETTCPGTRAIRTAAGTVITNRRAAMERYSLMGRTPAEI